MSLTQSDTASQITTNEQYGKLRRQDSRLIRVIFSVVLFAFLLILTLNSAQGFVEQHRVATARAFSQLIGTCFQLSTVSQRLALLLFGSLHPRDEVLRERLLAEIDQEVNQMKVATRELEQSLQAIDVPALGETGRARLKALASVSDQFIQTTSAFRSALSHETPDRELVGRFTEQASGILAESRMTIERLSQEAIASAMRDERIRTAIFTLNMLATFLTGALVLSFLVFRLRRELRLRRRTEAHLLNANQELERFSSIVAHDLKGPLNNIALSSRMLEKKANSSAEEKDLWSLISRETQRLKDMIQALLRLSRVSTARLRLETFDLRELISEIQRALETRMRECQASISIEGASLVRADPVLLRSLFQNLIENSIKYRQEGVPPRLSIDLRADREWLNCTYDDNGLGIPKEYREQVFEPFVQARQNGVSEGLGLGLSVVKKIAMAHGGAIVIVDKPAPGTRFQLVLPRFPAGE